MISFFREEGQWKRNDKNQNYVIFVDGYTCVERFKNSLKKKKYFQLLQDGN